MLYDKLPTFFCYIKLDLTYYLNLIYIKYFYLISLNYFIKIISEFFNKSLNMIIYELKLSENSHEKPMKY